MNHNLWRFLFVQIMIGSLSNNPQKAFGFYRDQKLSEHEVGFNFVLFRLYRKIA